MRISLFALDNDQKRRLIEILLLVFSILVVFPGKIDFKQNIYGILSTLFLLLAVFYWIASHDNRVNSSKGLNFVALVIAIAFSGIISTRVIEFTGLSGQLLELIFWGYYIMFTTVIYLALTTDPETKKVNNWYLKPWGKFIAVVIFILLIYALSRIF